MISVSIHVNKVYNEGLSDVEWNQLLSLNNQSRKLHKGDGLGLSVESETDSSQVKYE